MSGPDSNRQPPQFVFASAGGGEKYGRSREKARGLDFRNLAADRSFVFEPTTGALVKLQWRLEPRAGRGSRGAGAISRCPILHTTQWRDFLDQNNFCGAIVLEVQRSCGVDVCSLEHRNRDFLKY